MLVAGVSVFTGGVQLIIQDGESEQFGATTAEWAYFGSWLGLSVVGTLIQLCVTAPGSGTLRGSSKST